MAQRRTRNTPKGRPSSAPAPAPAAFYWLVPILLAGVQWWVTRASAHQVRYEELAEGVRSVYWLDQRLVYDGVYTNVGWYGTLLIVYKILGFSLLTARYVRLALHLAALVCIASLLRRAMGSLAAIVPLALIALSPTLLYFDSLQTSYAMDLSYAVICLWLVLSVRFDAPGRLDYGKAFAAGAIAMVAAMSYPAFAFYVPSLVLVTIWVVRRAGVPLASASNLTLLGAGVVGLVVPLAAVFLYVKTPQLLVFDPDTQAGLFRAGGKLGFNPAIFEHSLLTVLHDLFVQGGSYYYEVTRPDFAGPLAIAGLCGVLGTIVYLVATKQASVVVLSASLLLLAVSLIGPNLSIEGEPGLRRCTGVLAASFVLFAMAWRFYASAPRRNWWWTAGMLLCLLMPLDSALKVPSLVEDESSKSPFRNLDWFTVDLTPEASLDRLVDQINRGQRLSCPTDAQGRISPCRYQEVFPAIAGFRKWNGLPIVDIHAVDWKTGQDIILTPNLWMDKYYPTCTRIANCK